MLIFILKISILSIWFKGIKMCLSSHQIATTINITIRSRNNKNNRNIIKLKYPRIPLQFRVKIKVRGKLWRFLMCTVILEGSVCLCTGLGFLFILLIIWAFELFLNCSQRLHKLFDFIHASSRMREKSRDVQDLVCLAIWGLVWATLCKLHFLDFWIKRE